MVKLYPEGKIPISVIWNYSIDRDLSFLPIYSFIQLFVSVCNPEIHLTL